MTRRYNILTIGDRIKGLRKERKLTADELGKEINYSRQSIGKIERGEGKFNIENLIQFANYFDVSTDYILGGSGDHKQKSTEELGLELGLDEESVLALKKLNDFKGKDSDEIQTQKANLEVINLFLKYINRALDDTSSDDEKKGFPLFSPFNPIYSYIHSDDGFHTFYDNKMIPVTMVTPEIDGVDPTVTMGELYRARLAPVIINTIDTFYRSIKGNIDKKKRGGKN